MTIEHKLIVSLEARSADRRVYGLRPFSTARDDPLHGRDADRKIGGPRYLLCYASQFSPRQDWRNLFPSRADCRERLASQARHFGDMIGVRYGEPFVTREVAAVDDLVHMPVRSI